MIDSIANRTVSSNLGYLFLGLFCYALTYTGVHQYLNPIEYIEECSLVDHHLHQDPDSHECQLCYYQLQAPHATNDFQLITIWSALELDSGTPLAAHANINDTPALRGPPSA